jgi:hypothetical protein
LADAWPGSPLFGIRYHKAERIDTKLRQCETLSVRDEMETIDSEACYVIDAKSPTSTYTVWLNPKRGYSISHAVIKHGPGTQGRWVLSENEDRSLTVSDVRFQQIGEVHVPMAYNLYSERRRDGVVWRHGTIRGKVTDISFNPDHEKLASFVPKMRDGTLVRDSDFGIEYQWYDGKLIRIVDEFAIEQVDRITEDIMAQSGVREGTVAAEKTEAVPSEPPATVDERPARAADMPEQARSDLKILYAGLLDTDRAEDYVGFLGKHFKTVETTDYKSFTGSEAAGFDVTIIDYDGTDRRAPRLRLPRDYTKATITVGVPGAHLCSGLSLKTGYL